MKLISYLIDGTPSYGAVTEDEKGVVDLARRLPSCPDLRALIRAGSLEAARQVVSGASTDYLLADIALLPPIPTPEKIWCIGVNYANRNEEYRDGSNAPQYPSLFCRTPNSVVGHQQPLERPKISEQFDYEGEIVMVIAREGRHVPRESAFDYIFGLTLCNEGTVRDWVRHGKFNATQGKNFDRSGAIGPWIVTSDSLDPRKPLDLTTRVNGDIRQSDTTARLIFSFDFLISYLTTFATLKPGDLIVTGTPTGAGARFDPPRWLKPGDTVEVDVPGIGILSNTVVDEL